MRAPSVSLASMFRAGAAALGRRPGTFLGVYLAQLGFALVFLFGAAQALGAEFASAPAFDAAVAGDDAALADVIEAGGSLWTGLVMWGVGLALAWWLCSLFLTGGVIARVGDVEPSSWREGARRFGAAGAANLGRFLKLWLWSWLLWIPTLIVLGVGAARGSAGLSQAVDLGAAFGRLAGALAPGLLCAFFVSLAVDGARCRLVAEDALGARRALVLGLRQAAQPRALVHFAAYVAAWVAISALYVAVTAGRPFVGAALVLFLIRQLVVAARLALRVMTYAGQAHLAQGLRQG